MPIEYRDVLQKHFWKDGYEMNDPVYGQLYCVRHTNGCGAEIMSYLAAMCKLREEKK